MTSSPAYASTGCYGSGCNGKDPQAMGCSADAFTGASATSPDGRIVQLRYSPACGAAWGRLQSAYVGDYVAVQSNNGAGYHYTYVDGSHTWAAMVQGNGGMTAYAAYESSCCDAVTGNY
jgi:hypothetical protein